MILDDIEIVAKTIYGEARGEEFIGMLAVGYVIVNRQEIRHLSIKDVVLAKKQFSCWNTRDPNLYVIATAPTENLAIARAAATTALFKLAPDPTNGADHYHSALMPVFPKWASGMKETARIGNHIFYRSVA